MGMHDVLNKKYKGVLNSGKVLVNVRIESEDTTVLVVRCNDGKDYFVRLLGSNCYALVSLDDCEDMPVKTYYPNSYARNRYELYVSGFNDIKDYIDVNYVKTKTMLASSNNLEYLLEENKAYRSFNKYMWIVDNEIDEVIVVVENVNNRQSETSNEYFVKRYLPKDKVNNVKEVFKRIVKEFKMENVKSTLKMTSTRNNIYLVDTPNNVVDISKSRYLESLNFLINGLENYYSSELECILFRPVDLFRDTTTVYGKDSMTESGNVRIIIK